MAFLSSERFCVESTEEKHTSPEPAGTGMENAVRGKGWGWDSGLCVLFTLEMKLSPANLAFRKRPYAFFFPLYAFPYRFENTPSKFL